MLFSCLVGKVAQLPRQHFQFLKNPLVIVLEGVEKARQTWGPFLRSADAAGVSALILADSRVDLYNPNANPRQLGDDFLPARFAKPPAAKCRSGCISIGSIFSPPEWMGRCLIRKSIIAGRPHSSLGSEADGLTGETGSSAEITARPFAHARHCR